MSQSRPYFPNTNSPLLGLKLPAVQNPVVEQAESAAPAETVAEKVAETAAPTEKVAPKVVEKVAPKPATKAVDDGPFKAKIIAFCCNYCAYAAADLAGSRRMQYPAEVRVIHVPCTGKVEPEHILGAFEKGADGVLIAGCLEGGCHFLEGNLRAKRRANYLKTMLDAIGLKGERLLMVNLSAAMAPTFVQRVNEIVEIVHRLGQSPLNSRKAAPQDSLQQEGPNP